jgi:translocation and assembly module TamB
MRWLKRGAAAACALALLALAAAGAGLWAVNTERGTAWLVRRLLAAAPQVSVERVRGTPFAGLVLEGVRFRTALDELEIDSLTLELDAGALFAGTLELERAAATRAAYRRLPGSAPAGGGPPELPWPLAIRAASVAELSIEVAGETFVLRSASAAVAYEAPRLVLTDLTTTYGETAVEGSLAVDLANGIALDVSGEWSGPLAGVAAAGALELRGTWPALALKHELMAPFAATTTGTIDAAARAVDVVTEWQDLAWSGIASPSGRLALAGSIDDYRYDACGSVALAGRAASFTAAGTGARLALAVERLELAPAAPGSGTLTATGTVNLASRAAAVDVAARGFDPAWLAAAWPGRLDGTARVAAVAADEPAVTLEAIDLSGELRGYPVVIAGAANLTGRDRVRLDGLELTSNDNRAVLTGTLDAASLDIAVAAERIELDLVLPGAGGALTADVAVTGTWQEPQASGRLELRDAEVAGITVERLEANGALGLAPTAPVALTLAGTGIARGPIGARAVSASVTGTAGEHRARVGIAGEGYAATLSATGGLLEGAWRGALDALAVDEQVLGPWRLESPAALAIGRGSVSLGTACLRHASNARWCAELDLSGAREDRLVVSGQNFDLAALRPLLPRELELAGVYQLSGALFDFTGEPRGAVALTGGTTRVRVAFGDEPAFATELTRVDAGMTLEEGRLELTAAVRNAGGGSIDVDAAIADVRASDSPIDGALRVAWPDLDFLTLLSPELGEAAGVLTAALDVAGTVAEPTVDGRAGLANGRVVVPRWGLVVESIEATAASSDGRSLTIDATGRAGDGTLTLSGTTQLDPAAGWPTRLALRGESVLAVQRPDAEIYASPNLDVAVALPRLDVTGTVHVPRARITLEGLPAQAVAPSPDAVVHGLAERAARVRRPLELNTAIELTLGDDVRYTGLNLDTAVSGALSLATRPNESANATGTLHLAGTYDAYGQELTLEDGQLLFNGPLADPGLDVHAVRTFEGEPGTAGTEVGIELTGTLREPRTRVFSRPAMNEADALSYLLFGRPASGSNAGLGTEETSTLQTAALSLGLQQALPVVQRIGNTLGLDELTVRSTATDAGALMAGKYLSPKLYIRYSYGLFNRIGGLLLRFRVNERLSIETRSGEQKSMDLLYTVEKE